MSSRCIVIQNVITEGSCYEKKKVHAVSESSILWWTNYVTATLSIFHLNYSGILFMTLG